MCPHEWFITCKRDEWTGHDFETIYDIYCPLCEKEEESYPKELERLLKRQEIRNLYNEIE